jgi:ketosteroid isomerase-like protein
MADDRTFEGALERVGTALASMASGDPQPYIDRWAERPDVTLFGAWGPIEQGHERLAETFRWVGGRFTGGPLVPDNLVAFESGDLAYTVGYEHTTTSIDGVPVAPYVLRVTHVYRRDGSDWLLVHRHADPLVATIDLEEAAALARRAGGS